MRFHAQPSRLYIILAVVLLASCGASATPTEPAATAAAPTLAATAALAATATEAAAATVEATGVAAAPEKCADVARVDPASDAAKNLAAAVAATNTSFGAAEEIRSLDQAGGWSLLEARYADSEPGIFLLRDDGGTLRIAAVWGGVPESVQQIRDYLAEQAPEAPPALLACFAPQGAPFKPEAS